MPANINGIIGKYFRGLRPLKMYKYASKSSKSSLTPFSYSFGYPSEFPITRYQTTISSTTPHSSQLDNLNESNQSRQSRRLKVSTQTSTSDPLDCQSQRQPETDLLYLHILNDAVTNSTKSSPHLDSNTTSNPPGTEDSITPRKLQWARLPRLDDISNEYLVKKGVFDLPPPRYL